MNNAELKKLFEQYDNYKNKNLSTERLKHSDAKSNLKLFNEKKIFDIRLEGYSIEEREIFSVTFGNGKTKILAWSQMHGDEPTATTALFDLMNFFSADDEFNNFRNFLFDKITFCFVPMLNPDGAEKHQRANKINIDINRDALKKQTPESQILWMLAQKIKPQFGFNLHDQNSYYTAGRSGKSAAVSLLAPPVDFDKTVDDTRLQSMQVISVINKMLSEYIPGHIARYNDDFEPRAFGDNLTRNKISSILIESGFIKKDIHKETIRKLNFIALVSAFNTIADESYKSKNAEDYFSIPENESLLFDLLLKNLSLHSNGKDFTVDIGINREKCFDETTQTFYFKGTIKEVGDLSIYNGIEEHDLRGYSVECAKIYDKEFHDLSTLHKIDFHSLLSNGYGYIAIGNETETNSFFNFPINAIPKYRKYTPAIAVDEYANLVLTKNSKIESVVINGFYQDLAVTKIAILNGLVIS